MNFILGQVMSAIALVITIISFQQKNKNTILFLLGFANICYTFSYFFLDAFSGMVLEIVATVRMFSFFFLNKDESPHPIRNNIVFLAFELVIIGSAIATWNSGLWYASLVQLSGYLLYTYGCWQKDIFVYYTTYIYVCLCVIFYNCFFNGWVNIGIHILLIFVVLRAYLSKRRITKALLIRYFRAYKLDKRKKKPELTEKTV